MEREKFVPPSTDHDTLTRRMVTLQLLLARREFERFHRHLEPVDFVDLILCAAT